MKSLLLKIFLLCFFVTIIACSPDKRIIGKYSRDLLYSVPSYEFFDNNKIVYTLKLSDGSEIKTDYKWKKENGKYFTKYKLASEYSKEWKPFNLEYINTNQIKIDDDIYYYTIDGVMLVSILSSSPDSQFIGNYSKISGPLNNYVYISYEFSTNNKVVYYSIKNVNGNRSKPRILDYEWKKENDIYYWKRWNDQFYGWRVFELEYVSPTEIKIDNIVYDL